MLQDIVEAKALPNHQLWVRFEDGASGTIDFRSMTDFKGVFALLSDPQEFAKVSVNTELGVVCWPHGADLDSDVLYAAVTKKPISLRKTAMPPSSTEDNHDRV